MDRNRTNQIIILKDLFDRAIKIHGYETGFFGVDELPLNDEIILDLLEVFAEIHRSITTYIVIHTVDITYSASNIIDYIHITMHIIDSINI